MALETVSSGRWRRTSAVSDSRVCQATVLPWSIARCPSASTRCDLPAPLGPQTTEVLRSAEPFQRPERVLGGGGDRRGGLVPDVEGLAGRQPGRAAAHPDRGRVAAGGFLDQQDADDFGRVPALRAGGREDLRRGLAQVGQPQAAGERVRRAPGAAAARAW